MLVNTRNWKKQGELIAAITFAQMKSRYRKTFAGFVWVVLNPVLTFVVQAIIFKHILKIEIENYFVFLMSGLVPWIFIMSSLTMTVNTFITNRSTLMAFKIDPWVFLISQILDNFINFIASYLVMICFIDFSLFFNPWLIPLFILTTLLLVIFVFFLSLFLATLNVYFRDTQYILQFVTTLALFITPIFYPPTLLPLNYQRLIELNPFYVIIKPFQNLIWKYDFTAYWQSFAIAASMTFGVCILACLYWRNNRNGLFFRI